MIYMVSAIEEFLIKVKPHNSGPKLRYQAIVMVSDGAGDYGFGEKYRKNENLAVCGATAIAYRTRVQLELGAGYLRNQKTVPRRVRANCGSVVVDVKPAPRGVRMRGPPLAKKMLQKVGVHDCILVVKGPYQKRVINLAHAMNCCLLQLKL